MTVKQLSVFAENRPGRLAEMTRLLGDKGITIKAMSIADTKDFGILRLIVNDCEKAYKLLEEDNCAVTLTDVLAIKIANKAGGLAEALEALYEGKISVEYMYSAFIKEHEDEAYLILRVDNTELAVKTLNDKGFTLVKQDELVNFDHE
ncbi:MAG: ACT domain-containing protein [Ruminococcus sp.]|nr:ACT domain-containing protein [Ruminococcus sp.]